MTADPEPTQPLEQNATPKVAAIYDPSGYVVQGPAIVPPHRRSGAGASVLRVDDPAAHAPVVEEPGVPLGEPSLPERIGEQTAAEVVAETIVPTDGRAAGDPGTDDSIVDLSSGEEPAVESHTQDHVELPRLATRGPRRVNESALYRAREYDAVHAERRAAMTRRTQILAFGISGVAVLLGGAAVGSGLAHSRSILVGVFCFGAPLLLQLILSAWLEESIRAVRAQDYLVALETAINERLDHRSVGFESWLRRPHSRLELPYRWVADFAVVLSIATAVIGWESAHLSGVDFLWAVCLPVLIAGTGRYWTEQTLKHLEAESRRRIRLEP